MSILNDATEFVTSFIRKKPAAITNPHLTTAIRFPHGPFQFKIRVAPGTAYEIEGTTDLKTWIPLANNTAADENFEYLDSDAPKFGFRFYRVIAGGTLRS